MAWRYRDDPFLKVPVLHKIPGTFLCPWGLRAKKYYLRALLSASVGLRWGLRFCIFNKLHGIANAARKTKIKRNVIILFLNPFLKAENILAAYVSSWWNIFLRNSYNCRWNWAGPCGALGAQKPFRVPCFLAFPEFQRWVQTLANQGSEGMQRQQRNSQKQ